MEMRIAGLMLARNEDWCIGLTARAALEWVDYLIVLNHCSTDWTSSILEDIRMEHPARIQVLFEPDPVWYEMQYRQRMLHEARMWGATHIATIDADELISGNLLPLMRPTVEKLELKQALEPPWVGLRGDCFKYHINGVWGTNWASAAFLDHPQYFWRSQNGYDFHHRRPMGSPMETFRPWKQGEGGILHLQFVDDRRLRAKQACYKMQEVLRWTGRDTLKVINERYNPAVYGTPGDVLAQTPNSWWEPYLKWSQYLKLDDCEPWQERQCKEWMAEHPGKFKGLDLFGVA